MNKKVCEDKNRRDFLMRKCALVIMALFYSFLSANMLFAGQKADLGTQGRYGAVGFSIGGKGYIGTGYDGTTYYKDFWEYNPETNAWTQKADFDGAGRYGAVGFSIGVKGYIGTGYDGTTYYKDFREYDPETNAWTQKADFDGAGRYGAVGFVAGGKGYIGTGYDGTTYYKDFREYNPETDIWTPKTDFSGAGRYGAAGFSIDNKGYLGTGYDGTTCYKDFWAFDPGADSWARKADFGGAARYGASGSAVSATGYIGTGFDGSTNYDDVWEYDPGENIWTQKAFFEGTGRYFATGFVIGTRGFIGTGLNGSTEYNDFWEYDPNADITPDPFTFLDQQGVAWGRAITSNAITVSGIKTVAPISIEGGTYSVNGGDYTDEAGTVSNGDTVTVRQTSSAVFHTTTDATLTIGTVSDTFSVTTKYIYDEGDSGPCFIATAAFGSPLAGQVEILRQFRDRYLLKNDWGRKFVAWYYRNGSVAARFIEDKPLIKLAVRTALYPLVGFSWLLIAGYLPLILLGCLLAALLVYRYRPGQSKMV